MEFKKGAHVSTDDFWYDLTDGGYIKPEKLIKGAGDLKRVKNALMVLLEFKKELEDQNIIEYR